DSGNSFISVNDKLKGEGNKIIALKDNISQCETLIHSASKVLEGYKCIYDSTIVKKLEKAGYFIVGRTNMDEFAMGSTSRTSYFGAVDNAINTDMVPGGSSSGSAYAVAKGLVPVALGTDTGGSVRQPAAFNGIYGLKPTYGIVSRYGIIPFGSSFDVIGPLSRTVIDNATVLKDIAGNDHRDQTNFVPEGFDPTALIGKNIDGLKIGVIKEWQEVDYDPEIKAAIARQISLLKEKGIEVKEYSVPATKFSFELYLTLAYAEASSNLNRFDGIRYGYHKSGNDAFDYKSTRQAFGTEVKKRLLIGAYMLDNEHSKRNFDHGQRVRKKMDNDFQAVFSEVDLIIGPTTPSLPFPQETSPDNKDAYLADIFAIPANLCGMPSLNVPIGFSKSKLPIGMSIMGNRYDEAKIYQLASFLEGGENE
ncbi:MAG: Asp-tRNA(Asn)/Glu-tRNA(Gln) amidotransferase subunit GatA, partial [Spiroplasma sp.]|nr:Asp-tRNA(Asn)/Glu-tRNA(Gln) amidotransferase subunit GatA [Mycoplasmatales bacterium]